MDALERLNFINERSFYKENHFSINFIFWTDNNEKASRVKREV